MHGTPAIDQASNDIGAVCSTGTQAALVTSAGQSAYVYRFDRSVRVKGESLLATFHSLEAPCAFGIFDAHMMNWVPFAAIDSTLGGILQSYWTTFAKHETTDGAGASNREFWTTRHEPYMTFLPAGTAVLETDLAPIFFRLSPDRLKEQLANN